MKKHILIFLLLTGAAQGQFMPFGFWKTTASAPATFTPLSLGANLKYWFAADSITGKSNGDTLYHWRNLARPAFTPSHLFQLTASQKPVYRDSSGVKWVSFDGSDDWLRTGTDTAYSNPVTIFAAYRKPFETNTSRGFPASDDNATTTPAGVTVYTASYNSGVRTLTVYSGATVATNIYVYGDSMRVQAVTLNGASGALVHKSLSAYYSRSALNFGSDAIQGRTLGAGRPGSESNTTSTVKWYEYAVYVGTMSDADRDAMLTYLYTKYGL